MRFAVRFQRLPASARFHYVAASGLGVWNKAAASVTRYRFRKKVENLPAPAFYRAVVSYRWLTAAGTGGLARRPCGRPRCATSPTRGPISASAAITALRPSARAWRTFTPRRGRTNDGASPTGPFQLEFAPGDGSGPKPGAPLAAGGRRVVRFTAPRCTAGSTVKADVDPDNRVAERDESDNSLGVDCPTL